MRLVFALLLCGAAFAQDPNVKLTGTLQGPNGLPAANQLISLTPTQVFFVAGLGSAACNSYTLQINGVGLTCADTVNFNNTTPVAPSNGLNVIWAKSTSGITDSVSAAVVGDGNSTHCLVGTGVFSTCIPSGGTLANNPTLGRFVTVFGAQGQAGNTYGASVNQSQQLGTLAAVNAGATDDQGSNLSAAATASTNTVIGVEQGSTAGRNAYGMQSWYRWSLKFIPGNTTNVRYWLALTANTGNFLGFNNLATDTPTAAIVGFRYSAGVDTHWVVVTNDGAAQGTIDTGIPLDTTNSHLFEITWDGTNYNFFYDNTQVVTTSAHVPAATQGATMFWTGDNKNTNTAIAGTFFWMTLRLK